VGSPITLSNFNNIDFSMILNAVMQQESLPLVALQVKQSELSAENSAYAVLASKLGALETAATGLSTADAVAAYTASVSDASALSATATSSAVAGRYEVVINELARAQVTVSQTTAANANTTPVATGGTLTIGGVAVTVSGAVTLQGLAAQINATSGIPVSAAVVESSPGAFRLVLTGATTGSANAFTITNGLTGGSGVAFTDTNSNGTSGDSAADNAVQATNASVLVNNILITSASNTLTSGIPGTTLTLAQKDTAKTIVVAVASDNSALTSKIQSFTSAYNDLVAFTKGQITDANNGRAGTLGRDGLLRQLGIALRAGLGAAYGGSTFTHLAEVGIGLDRKGTLTLDETALKGALQQDRSSVSTLLAGSGGTGGAFAALRTLVQEYTQAGGFVASARTVNETQITRLGSQLINMQARLAVRRAALQREYIAADQAMTQLKAQSGNLASFGASSGGGLFSNTSG
jgi:flagellar hook-associated protein 2